MVISKKVADYLKTPYFIFLYIIDNPVCYFQLNLLYLGLINYNIVYKYDRFGYLPQEVPKTLLFCGVKIDPSAGVNSDPKAFGGISNLDTTHCISHFPMSKEIQRPDRSLVVFGTVYW